MPSSPWSWRTRTVTSWFRNHSCCVDVAVSGIATHLLRKLGFGVYGLIPPFRSFVKPAADILLVRCPDSRRAERRGPARSRPDGAVGPDLLGRRRQPVVCRAQAPR